MEFFILQFINREKNSILIFNVFGLVVLILIEYGKKGRVLGSYVIFIELEFEFYKGFMVILKCFRIMLDVFSQLILFWNICKYCSEFKYNYLIYLVSIFIFFVGYQMLGFSELKLKKILGYRLW